jgi:hypothetical protein
MNDQNPDPPHVVTRDPAREAALRKATGAPEPSVRVTVTESESRGDVPMILTLLKNAWAAWRHGEPVPGHEVLCMGLAFRYGLDPAELVGEVIENPLRTIPDEVLPSFLASTGGSRVERLRPRPPASAPKFLAAAAVEVTNAHVATVRVTMSETMWMQLQALTTFGLRMDEARGLVDLDVEERAFVDGPNTQAALALNRERRGEVRANALAFVLGADVSATVFHGEVLEAPLTVLPDAQWWSMTDEERGLVRVVRCGTDEPLAPLRKTPEDERALADARAKRERRAARPDDVPRAPDGSPVE